MIETSWSPQDEARWIKFTHGDPDYGTNKSLGRIKNAHSLRSARHGLIRAFLWRPIGLIMIVAAFACSVLVGK